MLRVEVSTPLREFRLELSLETGPGCLALAGPSGAGKTTLLRVVAGLLEPERGRVSCAEEVWLDTDAGVCVPPEQRRCGFLFQDYALFPHLRAWENVAYGLREVPRRERRARAEELLDRFDARALADAHPGGLSGGERQRVALARALAREPHALLLDEPLAALDSTTRARASRQLGELMRQAGVPALLVTHDFSEAAALGDRVAVLREGRVEQEGTPSELAATPASAFVADFTGAVVLPGSASPGVDGLTVVTLDGGGELTSTDAAAGPVAASIYPWEIALEPAGEAPHGSARNRLSARVVTLTPVGNRVRVALAAPQPLAAELTATAARALGLEPGKTVVAVFKATATRLVAR
jgi:molybdate transport system ATP-binding protein